MAITSYNLSATELVEHQPALLVVAAPRVIYGIDECNIFGSAFDLAPIVFLLEYWVRFTRERVREARHEYCLVDVHADVFEDTEYQSCPCGMTDQNGLFIERMVAENFRKESVDRLVVDVGVAWYLNSEAFSPHLTREPWVPEIVWVTAGSVKDDGILFHSSSIQFPVISTENTPPQAAGVPPRGRARVS
jgi:hypothetical protein